MGNYGEELQHILEEQKRCIEQYEKWIASFKSDEMQQQNVLLEQNLAKLEKKYETLKKEYTRMEKEAQALNWALHEQIASEKLGFITQASKRVDTYFREAGRELQNKLTSSETEMKAKVNRLKEILATGIEGDSKGFEEQTKALEGEISQRLKTRQRQFEEQSQALKAEWANKVEELKQEPVNEETLKKPLKQNNIEAKIGLNWINKIGIILILAGIITAMKYSYTNLLTNELKGVFGFVIGLFFLGAGELLQRKSKTVFAQGLIGGGIGALYLTLFSSYFILDILDMKVAVFLAVLISLATFILSLRYKSRSIAALGLIGGYLPFLSYSFMEQGLTGNSVYIGMFYILLLNGITLLLSRYKDWPDLYYLSFCTNVPITLYLTHISPDARVGMAYNIVVFGVYLGILLGYSLKHKVPLTLGKIMVLGFNTFISCVEIYRLFVEAGWKDFRGLLAVLFCIIYILLAKHLQKKVPEERIALIIFRITSLTFAILIIPFQFGRAYLTLGWLIEAFLLIGYGLKLKVKSVERGGLVLFVLCIISFYWSALVGLFLKEPISELDYGLTIGGMCFVLFLYLIKSQKEPANLTEQSLILGYKYFTLLNLWIYLMHITGKAIQWLDGYHIPLVSFPLVEILLVVGVTGLLAYGMSHIPLLYDGAMPYVCGTIYGILDLIGIWLSFYNQGIIKVEEPVGLVLIIIYNLLIFIHLRSVMRGLMASKRRSIEFYPIVLFLYLVIMITALLTRQLKVDFFAVGISLFYIVAAFLLIAFGFKWHYRLSRYWGLGLTILAIAKLFLLDFSHIIAIQYRLVSYFAFGIILLAISYLYQLFSKKLELGEEGTHKEKEAEQ